MYAVVQATLILARVAELSISAYRTGISLPAHATGTFEVSAASALIGLLLIVGIAWRFGLASAGRGMAKAGSALSSIASSVGLGIVLSVGLILADYWQWWLRAENQASPIPLGLGALGSADRDGWSSAGAHRSDDLASLAPALRQFPSEPIA